MRRTAVVAALIAVAAAPAAATADVRPAGATGKLGDEQLSDEQLVTRWAYASYRTPIRRRPSRAARAFARLHFQTEDGRTEPYVVLESRRHNRRVWLHIRVPGRPNGRKGWVPRGAMGTLHVVRTHLLIDRRRLRATLRRDGKVIWTARVGIGKRATPTPAGTFWVRERLRGVLGSAYGPWAFGTSAYSRLSDWPGGGVVGIHGTNQPGLIPGRPSHGCVRVRNAAIRKLARRMPIGTPITIV